MFVLLMIILTHAKAKQVSGYYKLTGNGKPIFVNSQN